MIQGLGENGNNSWEDCRNVCVCVCVVKKNMEICVCLIFCQMIPLHVCMCVQNTYADPGVFEGLCSSDTFTRVDGKHLVDQIFGLRSYSVPLWGRELSEIKTEALHVLKQALK